MGSLWINNRSLTCLLLIVTLSVETHQRSLVSTATLRNHLASIQERRHGFGYSSSISKPPMGQGGGIPHHSNGATFSQQQNQHQQSPVVVDMQLSGGGNLQSGHQSHQQQPTSSLLELGASVMPNLGGTPLQSSTFFTPTTPQRPPAHQAAQQQKPPPSQQQVAPQPVPQQNAPFQEPTNYAAPSPPIQQPLYSPPSQVQHSSSNQQQQSSQIQQATSQQQQSTVMEEHVSAQEIHNQQLVNHPVQVPGPAMSSQPPPQNSAPGPVLSSPPPPQNSAPEPVLSSQPSPQNSAPVPAMSSQSPPQNSAPEPALSSQPSPQNSAPVPAMSSQPPPQNSAPVPAMSSQPPPQNSAHEPAISSHPQQHPEPPLTELIPSPSVPEVLTAQEVASQSLPSPSPTVQTPPLIAQPLVPQQPLVSLEQETTNQQHSSSEQQLASSQIEQTSQALQSSAQHQQLSNPPQELSIDNSQQIPPHEQSSLPLQQQNVDAHHEYEPEQNAQSDQSFSVAEELQSPNPPIEQEHLQEPSPIPLETQEEHPHDHPVSAPGPSFSLISHQPNSPLQSNTFSVFNQPPVPQEDSVLGSSTGQQEPSLSIFDKPSLMPQIGGGSVFSNTLSVFNHAPQQEAQVSPAGVDDPNTFSNEQVVPSILNTPGGWSPSSDFEGPALVMDTSLSISSTALVSSTHMESVDLIGDPLNPAIAELTLGSTANHALTGNSMQESSGSTVGTQNSEGHIDGGSSQMYQLATMGDQNVVLVNGQSDSEGMGTVLQQSLSDTIYNEVLQEAPQHVELESQTIELPQHLDPQTIEQSQHLEPQTIELPQQIESQTIELPLEPQTIELPQHLEPQTIELPQQIESQTIELPLEPQTIELPVEPQTIELLQDSEPQTNEVPQQHLEPQTIELPQQHSEQQTFEQPPPHQLQPTPLAVEAEVPPIPQHEPLPISIPAEVSLISHDGPQLSEVAPIIASVPINEQEIPVVLPQETTSNTQQLLDQVIQQHDHLQQLEVLGVPETTSSFPEVPTITQVQPASMSYSTQNVVQSSSSNGESNMLVAEKPKFKKNRALSMNNQRLSQEFAASILHHQLPSILDVQQTLLEQDGLTAAILQ